MCKNTNRQVFSFIFYVRPLSRFQHPRKVSTDRVQGSNEMKMRFKEASVAELEAILLKLLAGVS